MTPGTWAGRLDTADPMSSSSTITEASRVTSRWRPAAVRFLRRFEISVHLTETDRSWMSYPTPLPHRDFRPDRICRETNRIRATRKGGPHDDPRQGPAERLAPGRPAPGRRHRRGAWCRDDDDSGQGDRGTADH